MEQYSPKAICCGVPIVWARRDYLGGRSLGRHVRVVQARVRLFRWETSCTGLIVSAAGLTRCRETEHAISQRGPARLLLFEKEKGARSPARA